MIKYGLELWSELTTWEKVKVTVALPLSAFMVWVFIAFAFLVGGA